METQDIQNDIRVFGVEVKTFPHGIGDAFDGLVNRVPGGFTRSFFGISFMEENHMRYFAAAQETFPGEGKQLGFDELQVQKGAYAAVTLTGWRDKTSLIKDIFSRMHADPRIDPYSPAVEWYKNNEEMVCLLKLKP